MKKKARAPKQGAFLLVKIVQNQKRKGGKLPMARAPDEQMNKAKLILQH